MVKVFKWKRRVVSFTAVAKKRSFLFCCCSAETEWRSCGILLLEKLLESFVRSQVDYKQLSRLAVSPCQWRLSLLIDNNVVFRTPSFVVKII